MSRHHSINDNKLIEKMKENPESENRITPLALCFDVSRGTMFSTLKRLTQENRIRHAKTIGNSHIFEVVQ
jgi:hypothetical protein